MTIHKSFIVVIVLAVVVAGGFYVFQNNPLFKQFSQEILNPLPLHIGGAPNDAVLVSTTIVFETNQQRAANGNLPPLTQNAKLRAAAQAKAEDMFAGQYFEHISPSGVDPGELVKTAGYDAILTGENLILGNFKDEKEVVQLWMDSPGHRANILNNRFTEIGVAIVKGTYKGETVWIGVQEFGLPLSSCQGPSVELKTNIEDNEKAAEALFVKIEAKRAEIKKTNPRSEEYNQMVDEYNALVEQYNALNDVIKKIAAEYNAQVRVFNDCLAGN